MAFQKPNRKVHQVFVHCSASDVPAHDNVATMRKWHKARGWSDVGYHLFIRKSGQLEKGRPLGKIPAAQAGKNTGTIAICLHGLKKDKFTEAQFETLKGLCKEINQAYDGTVTFHGHREVAAKACPVIDYKKVLKLDKFGRLGLNGVSTPAIKDFTDIDDQKLPDLKTGDRGPAVELLQELLMIKIDGVFGPKTANAVRAYKKSHGLYPSDLVVSHVWKLVIDEEKLEHFD